MYQSSARVRSFFVAAAAASLLAACSGGGMNATPATSGLGAQSTSSSRTPQELRGSPTPTVAPTATPASNYYYKIVTGLQMDSSGNFTEVNSWCSSDAPSFESDTAISLPVAAQTVLNVCTSGDDDNWGHHDDAISHFAPAERTF